MLDKDIERLDVMEGIVYLIHLQHIEGEVVDEECIKVEMVVVEEVEVTVVILQVEQDAPDNEIMVVVEQPTLVEVEEVDIELWVEMHLLEVHILEELDE